MVRQRHGALRWRSQKTRVNWERMIGLANAWLPETLILHSWPDLRIGAIIRDWAETGTVCGNAARTGLRRGFWEPGIPTTTELISYYTLSL